jgi:acyl carrier protein
VREKIREKIAGFVKQPLEKISDDHILTELVAESFLLVELVIELQEEFHARLMQEDLRSVKTVGVLISTVEKKQLND